MSYKRSFKLNSENLGWPRTLTKRKEKPVIFAKCAQDQNQSFSIFHFRCTSVYIWTVEIHWLKILMLIFDGGVWYRSGYVAASQGVASSVARSGNSGSSMVKNQGKFAFNNSCSKLWRCLKRLIMLSRKTLLDAKSELWHSWAPRLSWNLISYGRYVFLHF